MSQALERLVIRESWTVGRPNLPTVLNRLSWRGVQSFIQQTRTVDEATKQACRDIVRPLAEAIQYNTSLRILDLSGNGLTDVTPIVTMLRMDRSSLLELHLSNNALYEDSGIAFGTALRYNRTLKVLNLEFNYLSDLGCKAIVEGLMRTQTGSSDNVHPSDGSSLNTLRLYVNDAGMETIIALWKVLNMDRNVTLTRLGTFDEQLPPDNAMVREIKFLLRANNSGRYLLTKQTPQTQAIQSSSRNNQHGDDHYDDDDQEAGQVDWSATIISPPAGRKRRRTTTPPTTRHHPITPRGLWPFVLQRLEPDLMFYFLKEKPDLVSL